MNDNKLDSIADALAIAFVAALTLFFARVRYQNVLVVSVPSRRVVRLQGPFSLRLGSGPLTLFVRFFFPSNSTKRARSGGRPPGILRSSLNFSPSILGVTLAPLLLADGIDPEGRHAWNVAWLD